MCVDKCSNFRHWDIAYEPYSSVFAVDFDHLPSEIFPSSIIKECFFQSDSVDP